jgi:transposase, IS5 family
MTRPPSRPEARRRLGCQTANELGAPGRAARNHPLSERQKSANTTRSKVRARVEHVFGQQQNSMGGKIVRTIGIVRARFKIGMMNLGYNIRRLVQLERMAAAPA